MVDYPAGVRIIIVRPDGDILVLRRSETHPTKPFRTDLPGGLIEKGEPEVTAAVRELAEETGIKVEPNDLELFFADSFIHPFSQKSYTVLYYKVTLDKEPKIMLSFEHDKYEWCSPRAFLGHDDLESIQRKAVEYGMTHNLFKI